MVVLFILGLLNYQSLTIPNPMADFIQAKVSFPSFATTIHQMLEVLAT